MMKNFEKDKKGIALLTVLIMVLGIAGLGLALHYLGRVKVADILSRAQKLQTFYLAETGLSDAIWYFNNVNNKFYSDGSRSYTLETISSGNTKKVGEYNIYTSGVWIDNNSSFNNDRRKFTGSSPYDLYFLIWSGEVNHNLSSAKAIVELSSLTPGAPLITLTRNWPPNYNLDSNPLDNEGFTLSTTVNDTCSWYCVMTLTDDSITYQVKDMTLSTGSPPGVSSKEGIRKVKSVGYFPAKNSTDYRVKTILSAEGKIVEAGGGFDFKIRQLKK